MVGILIVSDIRFYREGLAQALATEAAFAIRGVAADAREALGLVRRGAVDVALIGLGLDQGLPLIHAIAETAPAVRAVAIGVPENGATILRWAEAGVAGYVARDRSLAEL